MLRTLVTTAISLVVLCSTAQGQNSATYTPIPAGFDFPAKSEDLLAALKAGNGSKLRTHTWNVFAGLTQPARPQDPNSEAIWETWYSGNEVFSAAATPQAVRTLQRRFTIPRQFLPQHGVAAPQAIGESSLSFTLFNQDMRDHTRTEKLYLASTLDAINAAWPASAPVADRKIKDYPQKAMSLKIIWKLVKKTGLTPLRVWDQQSKVAQAPAQPEETWKRFVAVDPSRSTIPPGEVTDIGSFKGAKVVALKDFYSFQLTKTQADQANHVPGISGAAEGDYAVVVAMHYTTKEIPNWVWATFWWHDAPDAGAFAEDRPNSSVLKGPWRHFLMDTSYDMDLPADSDGTPHSAFNPYLEAKFINGVNSNCMTCHRRAAWSSNDPAPDFRPITRGTPSPTDSRFVGATTVDFLWSLLLEGNQ